MTGYRHRYAEPLEVWAAAHAEPDDRPTPTTVTETCRYHGPWQMTPHDIDAMCPTCATIADRGARHDAEWDYRHQSYEP